MARIHAALVADLSDRALVLGLDTATGVRPGMFATVDREAVGPVTAVLSSQSGVAVTVAMRGIDGTAALPHHAATLVVFFGADDLAESRSV